VTYTPPTAADADDPEPPAVSCVPASGSTFPIGTTTVTCTATDADDSNSPVHAQFTVTVTGGLAQLQDLLGLVNTLPFSTSKIILTAQLQAAINSSAMGNTAQACTALFGVISTARRESKFPGQISPADAATVIAAANQIDAVIGCTFSPT
jgi:HYR domain